QGIREEERRRPLADRPVRPEDWDPETGKLAGKIAELLRLADRLRLPNVDQPNPVGFCQRCEFRVLAQVLVQSRDEVYPLLNRMPKDRPVFLRDVAAERGHA